MFSRPCPNCCANAVRYSASRSVTHIRVKSSRSSTAGSATSSPRISAIALCLCRGTTRPPSSALHDRGLLLVFVQEFFQRGDERFVSFLLVAGSHGQKRLAHFPQLLLQRGALPGLAVADEESPESGHG